jgi:vesicle-associated membrane protein 7
VFFAHPATMFSNSMWILVLEFSDFLCNHVGCFFFALKKNNNREIDSTEHQNSTRGETIMPLLYASVFDENRARIAEHPKSTDTATAVTPSGVPKLATFADVAEKITATLDPATQRRKTIEDKDNNTRYCCLSNGEGRIVVVVSSLTDTSARTAFAMLDAVEPLIRCPATQLRNGKKLLQMKMDFYNNPQNDKIAALAHEVDLVVDTMTANVEAALKRGDLVDALNKKTVTLAEQARTFHNTSTDVKQQMFVRNLKTLTIGGLGIIGAILLIAMISCRPDFSAC